MEVARNINDKNLANNNVPEEEEEYYDEEYDDEYDEEDELEKSSGSKNSKVRRKLSDSSKSLGNIAKNKLGPK